MAKKGIGIYLLIGLKGLVVSIVTMLIMILPMWLIRWLWNAESMIVVSAVFGLVWIFFYFVIWGFLAYKFWKWL